MDKGLRYITNSSDIYIYRTNIGQFYLPGSNYIIY